jgi:hypothetical protein
MFNTKIIEPEKLSYGNICRVAKRSTITMASIDIAAKMANFLSVLLIFPFSDVSKMALERQR